VKKLEWGDEEVGRWGGGEMRERRRQGENNSQLPTPNS